MRVFCVYFHTCLNTIIKKTPEQSFVPVMNVSKLKQFVDKCAVSLDCERNYMNSVFNVLDMSKKHMNTSHKNTQFYQALDFAKALQETVGDTVAPLSENKDTSSDGTGHVSLDNIDTVFTNCCWINDDEYHLFVDENIDPIVKCTKALECFLSVLPCDKSSLQDEIVEVLNTLQLEDIQKLHHQIGICGSLSKVVSLKQKQKRFWDVLHQVIKYMSDQQHLDPFKIIQAFIGQAKFLSELEEDDVEEIKQHILETGALVKSLPLTTEEQKAQIEKAEKLIPLLMELQNNNEDLDFMELMSKLAPMMA